MDRDFWQRIEEVYNKALECPPDERLALLDASCSSDPELRREVESLLAARTKAEHFLAPSELHDHIADLESNAPAVGSRVGKYEILAPIGSGASGEVFRAKDTELGREVALKILHSELTIDGGRVARFQSEARAASTLQHANVVTIFETGEAAGTWFIAAELVDGVTLRERMRSAILTFEEAVQIAIQCADALGAAHRAGIVHRDIKPENIMLRPDGTIKVVDFGLARIIEARPGWTVDTTKTNVVMGTPRYMSPEQARGQKTDARSDVFSLGAVLFEMISGHPAFPGETTAEVFAALLASEPRTEDAGPARAIIAKALAKDSSRRYTSMEQFSSDLRKLDPHGLWPGLRFLAHRPRAFIIGACLLIAVASFLATITGRFVATRKDPPEARELNLVPLTTFPGSKEYPALSPDGTEVAFSWRRYSSPWLNLYLKPERQEEPVQLTSSPHNDVWPAWSPDGEWIAFCRERPSGPGPQIPHDIYVIPARGGKERKIAQGWLGVSWSPDGKSIAAAELPKLPGNAGPAAGGIFVLSIESGQRRTLTSGQTDYMPVFSPDGKWVAYIRRYFGVADEVFVVPASGGPSRQLTYDHQPLRGATWTADSREVVFASWRSAAPGSLWRVPVGGGSAKLVSATLRDATYPSISRRGDRLVYRLEWIDTNIYVHRSRGWRNSAPQFGPVESNISSSRIDHSPALSPDGERIAFVSNRSGNQEIWVSRRDGTQAHRVTYLSAASTGTPRWSPDGKWIAFDSGARGTSAIFIIAATGGEPRKVTEVSTGSWNPSWSPDGKWIYFACRLSGSRQIWKVTAAGVGAVQVTRTGALEAKPASNGEVIYFTKPSRDGCCTIWSIPASGGEEKPVPELANETIQRAWGVVSDGIYFMAKDESQPPVAQFFSLRTRHISRLFALDKKTVWDVPTIDLSPDARFAAAVQLDQAVNDLMMIGNFR